MALRGRVRNDPASFHLNDKAYLDLMKQILHAIALSCCALVFSTAAWAEGKLSLNEISGYLNGMKTATASFTQINDDGTLTTGKLYLHRPGRMRFEYDGTGGGTVVAGAGAPVPKETTVPSARRGLQISEILRIHQNRWLPKNLSKARRDD